MKTKRIRVLFAAILAVMASASVASAAIPVSDSLASLKATGGSVGIGDKVFSNFDYLENGLVSFNPSNITVTASIGGDGAYYLTWAGNISVVSSGPVAASLKLNYRVTANPGLIFMIDQSYTGSANPQSGAFLTVDEYVYSGTNLVANSHLQGNDLSDPFTEVGDDLDVNPPESVLDVTKDIVFGVTRTNGGFVSISQIRQSFHQVPCPCLLDIICPPPATVQCGGDTSTNATGIPTIIAIGDCQPVLSYSDVTNVLNCPGNYDITRTWTVTPGCGDPESCTQTISVRDTTPPTITCSPNKTNECGTAIDFDPPTASDTCGAATISILSTVTNLTCGNTFVATRTWVATDECGNTNTCSQTIATLDTTPPAITCPTNLTVQCIGDVPACAGSLVAFLALGGTASDNCDNNLTYVCSDGPLIGGTCGGTIVRTHTVIDDCTNSASCTQIITVRDTIPPVITCPTNLTVRCIGDVPPCAGSLAAFLALGGTASDNCDTNLTYTCSDGPLIGGACGGTIVRTHTVIDDCTNSASCTQIITVRDTTPPVITCSSNKTIQCNGPFSFNPPSATDNCGTPTITVVNTTSNATACGFTTTRTWKARDACGNEAFCSQTVTMDCGTVCVPSSFNLEGSSALDGTDGNIRQFTVGGISVKASAFSRTKGVGGTWTTAYLGQYGGGLGVTDSSEGDGSNDRHTVDNLVQDNYVLFEFSQPVVLKGANLGYVVTDSDLTLWIGTLPDPFNIHTTLTDALLSSFYTEDNLTALTTPRSAVLNAGEVEGNVIVIAAQPGDVTPEDQFKIALLDICKRACPPPCTGSICGSVKRDCDADGYLTGESGLAGWTVKLKQGATVVGTTTTDANGNYCFNNLAAGTYNVVVTPEPHYVVTVPAGCNDQQTVNLAACQNKTGVNFGYTGTKASVNLVVTGPASAKCGDTIRYYFYVTNTGNTCVYGGLIVNSSLLGQVFHQTPVSPGQGFAFTKTYVVKASDPNPLVNTVTAIGDPPGGLPNVTKTVSVSTTKTCPAATPPPTCLTTAPGCNLVKLSWLASSGATSYNVKRSTTKGGPYMTIKTGLTGTSYTNNTTLVNGTVYYYVVSAVKSGVESANSNEASAIPSNGLPSPWSTKDIGAVGDTGGASYTAPTLTVVGSGVDIWGTGDEFRFVYQMASGNCEIKARVKSQVNTDAWAKAGVMIRETLNSNSRHAFMCITPGNGFNFQQRLAPGGASSTIAGGALNAAPNNWVKIVRNGNTFTASKSADGATWTQVGSPVTIPMTASIVYIGFGVTSHNDGVLSSATFDSVGATP